VQRALGATSWTMFSDVFAESVLVAICGAAFGILATVAGVGAVRALGQAMDLPRSTEVAIDGTGGGAAVLLTALAALFVGGVSALGSGASSTTWLAHLTNRSATTGRDRHRARQVLVAAQVALALVLLSGSGLMARSVWRLRAVQPGFSAANA